MQYTRENLLMCSWNRWANWVCGGIAAILCFRWTSAYFSYAMILFLLFVIADLFFNRPIGLRSTIRSFMGTRFLFYGLVIFYGILFFISVLLGDLSDINKAIEYGAFVLPFFMIVYLGVRYHIQEGFQWGIFAGGSLNCGYAIFVQYLNQPNIRLESVFASPNHFGMILEMLIPFYFYFGWAQNRIWKKTGYVILVVTALFCLYHTGSRGAIIALVGAIVGTCVIAVWMGRKQIKGKVVVCIFLFAIAIASSGAGILMHLNENRDGWGKDGGERQIMIEASYEMWKEHPWLGVGLAHWQENYYSEQYHPKGGREQNLGMPHNMPAYFFSTAGIWGGMGYLLFLGETFLSLLRSYGWQKSPLLFSTICMVFFAFTLHGLVDGTIIHRIPSRIYFFLLGFYFVALSYRNKKS